MFDTILRGGTVIDGTGRPAFPADIGITGGTITAVGDLSAAAAGRTMDVAGRTVTPGFIDIHRHADAAAFRPGYGSLSAAGPTTIVNGNAACPPPPSGRTTPPLSAPTCGPSPAIYRIPCPQRLWPPIWQRCGTCPCIPACWWARAFCGRTPPVTSWSIWTKRTTAPSTAPWSVLWATAHWAYRWDLATHRSASTPRRS